MSSSSIAAYIPVLTPEEEGEEESDVGDVVAVVAAAQLDDGDGQVGGQVAEAHRDDHLGHAPLARRQRRPAAVHLLAANRDMLISQYYVI